MDEAPEAEAPSEQELLNDIDQIISDVGTGLDMQGRAPIDEGDVGDLLVCLSTMVKLTECGRPPGWGAGACVMRGSGVPDSLGSGHAHIRKWPVSAVRHAMASSKPFRVLRYYLVDVIEGLCRDTGSYTSHPVSSSTKLDLYQAGLLAELMRSLYNRGIIPRSCDIKSFNTDRDREET